MEKSVVTSDQLKMKIETGEVKLKENKGMKSPVWTDFKLLFCEKSDQYIGHVQCIKCKDILKHDRSKSGTTHLTLHLKRCSGNRPTNSNKSSHSSIGYTQNKLTQFFTKKVALAAAARAKLVEACVDFVAADLRPLNAVEGRGFVSLIQTSFEIGEKYGNVDAKENVPSRHTVKRKVEERANSVKTIIGQDLVNSIKENGFIGLTTDMWSDVKQRHFVSLTAHFIKNGELKSSIATIKQFVEQHKTGQNIRECLIKLCQSSDIPLSDVMKHCCFVSDQGSNIKSALAGFVRLPCACHMVATVIRHALQLDKFSKTVLPMAEDDQDKEIVVNIQNSVSATKSLVAYFKRSGLNNKLSKALVQSCDTRWNSTFLMLQSLMKVYGEVEEILKCNQQDEKLHNIDVSVVNILIEFLAPFQEATAALEGDQYPTIHYVYMWFSKLQRSLHVATNDHPIVTFLKKRGSAALKEKFEISIFHLVGLFLNPKFKALLPLDEEKRKKVISVTTELTSQLISKPDQTNAHSSDWDTCTSPNKAQKMSIDDEFADWQNEGDISYQEYSEAQEYARACFDSELQTHLLVTMEGLM